MQFFHEVMIRVARFGKNLYPSFLALAILALPAVAVTGCGADEGSGAAAAGEKDGDDPVPVPSTREAPKDPLPTCDSEYCEEAMEDYYKKAEADFDMLLDSFKKDAAAFGYDLSEDKMEALTLKWSEKRPKTGEPSALCEDEDPAAPVVTLTHPKYWANELPTVLTLKAVFYHELGHCVMGRSHVFGDPADIKDIMYPVSPLNGEIKPADWEGMLKTFFDDAFYAE